MKDDDLIILDPEPTFKKIDIPILLDVSIGHSEKNRGAVATYNGDKITEWGQNHFKIRKALQEAIDKEGSGFKIRFWDSADHPDWGKGRDRKGSNLVLFDRLVSMYQNNDVNPKIDIVIDLHNNASKNTDYGGFMMIYRKEKNGIEDDAGRLLAECLCKSFEEQFPNMKNRGSQADNGEWVSRDLSFTKWGFRYKACPVIIEFGFMTCLSDLTMIVADDTPGKYAKAVLSGVRAFIEEEKKNGYR